MTKISPSILSCDFANLKNDIDTVIADIDYIHIDVMDGLFPPNIFLLFVLLYLKTLDNYHIYLLKLVRLKLLL